MEDNKYYTPELSEFCEGFEFEVAVINLIGDKPIKWVKQIFDFNFIGHFDCKNGVLYSVPSVLRVKRLDESDIEECGFNADNECDFIKGNIIIQFYPDDRILIYKKAPIDDDDEGLFNGFIKNKSELKKVLKMIGV